MTSKERRDIKDTVEKIRNIIYDLQADVDDDVVTTYCRKATREVDKLLYELKT